MNKRQMKKIQDKKDMLIEEITHTLFCFTFEFLKYNINTINNQCRDTDKEKPITLE